MIWRLLWRNLWRNSKRTLITMGSIMFAVMLSVLIHSLKKGVFDHLVRNIVGNYAGYVQVHKNGYWEEQVLDNCMIQDSSLLSIMQHRDVSIAVPRIESFMLGSGPASTKGCLLVGTDMEKENLLSGLNARVVSGSAMTSHEEVVSMGEGLARKLGLHAGDTMVLFGQGYQGVMAAGKYPVKAILHFGNPTMNDNFVYLPLPAAQYLLSAESMLSSLAIIPVSGKDPEILVGELKNRSGSDFEVMSWKELMPEIDHHIQAEGYSYFIFTGILYLIIGFGFFGTVLMMTAERKSEFSMLLAIGMKRSKLGWLLFFESLLLSILGVFSGILLSFPLVWYFHEHPMVLGGKMAEAYINFGFEPLFPTAMDSGIFISQALIVFAMAMLVGMYPLWKVRKVSPLIHAA